jgi:heme-degrading monooxygenase HmoA
MEYDMADDPDHDRPQHVHRVDRFVVPRSARGEFLNRVRKTHERLRELPGFLWGHVLERVSGTGDSDIVTAVEWDSPRSVENAKDAIRRMHQEMRFDPKEMFERLGIQADQGSYQRVDA